MIAHLCLRPIPGGAFYSPRRGGRRPGERLAGLGAGRRPHWPRRPGRGGPPPGGGACPPPRPPGALSHQQPANKSCAGLGPLPPKGVPGPGCRRHGEHRQHDRLPHHLGPGVGLPAPVPPGAPGGAPPQRGGGVPASSSKGRFAPGGGGRPGPLKKAPGSPGAFLLRFPFSAAASGFFKVGNQSRIIRPRMYLMVYFKPFSPFSPVQVGEWGSMDKCPSQPYLYRMAKNARGLSWLSRWTPPPPCGILVPGRRPPHGIQPTVLAGVGPTSGALGAGHRPPQGLVPPTLPGDGLPLGLRLFGKHRLHGWGGEKEKRLYLRLFQTTIPHSIL